MVSLKKEDFTGCKAYLVTLIDIKKEQALPNLLFS